MTTREYLRLSRAFHHSPCYVERGRHQAQTSTAQCLQKATLGLYPGRRREANFRGYCQRRARPDRRCLGMRAPCYPTRGAMTTTTGRVRSSTSELVERRKSWSYRRAGAPGPYFPDIDKVDRAFDTAHRQVACRNTAQTFAVSRTARTTGLGSTHLGLTPTATLTGLPSALSALPKRNGRPFGSS